MLLLNIAEVQICSLFEAKTEKIKNIEVCSNICISHIMCNEMKSSQTSLSLE